MEQSIPKQTAGQNKAIGTELSHADAPGASLPGLRQTKPTLQLTAPSHKKDINLEGFFHCQSFAMLFPAPSVAEHQHPYFAFCSFLLFFFLFPCSFHATSSQKTGSAFLLPSYNLCPQPWSTTNLPGTLSIEQELSPGCLLLHRAGSMLKPLAVPPGCPPLPVL